VDFAYVMSCVTDELPDIDITVGTSPLNFLNYSDIGHHHASVDMFR
jgi:hypothetical protein